MTLRTNGFQLALVKISDSKLNNKLYQKNHKLLKRPIKWTLIFLGTYGNQSPASSFFGYRWVQGTGQIFNDADS